MVSFSIETSDAFLAARHKNAGNNKLNLSNLLLLFDKFLDAGSSHIWEVPSPEKPFVCFVQGFLSVPREQRCSLFAQARPSSGRKKVLETRNGQKTLSCRSGQAPSPQPPHPCDTVRKICRPEIKVATTIGDKFLFNITGAA